VLSLSCKTTTHSRCLENLPFNNSHRILIRSRKCDSNYIASFLHFLTILLPSSCTSSLEAPNHLILATLCASTLTTPWLFQSKLGIMVQSDRAFHWWPGTYIIDSSPPQRCCFMIAGTKYIRKILDFDMIRALVCGLWCSWTHELVKRWQCEIIFLGFKQLNK
jgi:hypothetical protein